MNEITDTLIVFFNIFRDDILEYYQKCYSYLKDLVAYKKIDINKKIEIGNEKQIQDTLLQILKAVKTGLNTIGISMDKLNGIQKTFIDSIDKEEQIFHDYNSYFEMYLKNYVNSLLFEILFDYLLNIDAKKLENVNLFNLLPPYFISKLNEFKKSHFSNPNSIEIFKQQNYKELINFTTLTLIIPKKDLDSDILTQLKQAKEGFIETLKTPKKEVLKKSIDYAQRESIQEELKPQITVIKPRPQVRQESKIILNTGSFLDNLGCFKPISTNILDKFKIDKLNLINLKVVNPDYFDLESLYHYISILRMLNLNFPFTNNEIIDILKKYINRFVFSSSKGNIPDSIDNFYGLAIFSELNLFNKTNIVDIPSIENLVLAELKNFIPEKLEMNFHSLLCIKLLTQFQKQTLKKNLKLESISGLNLLETDNFKPTLDIFHHISSLKLLDQEDRIDQLKTLYINELKRSINLQSPGDELLTESARILLVFDILKIKETESELCTRLLNTILNKTSFFFMDNIDKEFNWRSDKLCFNIELEMLYWTLLAYSQYTSFTL
ncbi:MAG: hypothetical protein ACFFG0_36800 [Candidatus Thorarchaeota archaeon]